MNTKDKVGLALGSGSARGWAHIGIIEALCELGINIHCVSGCSSGALIGAVYAAGHLDDFKKWLLGLTKREMASLLDLNISGGGMLAGKKIMKWLQQFGLDKTFEDLSIPFAAVATDLHNGREIWLNSGSLEPAIRSSIALPGLFKPFFHQEKWLVDGGLVNPVPVSTCRSLGADIVLAVNLNHDLMFDLPVSAKELESRSLIRKGIDNVVQRIFGKESEPGYYDVLSLSIKIMQDRITRARAAGDPADICFEPSLMAFSMIDFDKAESLIKIGHECVHKNIEKINKLLF